MNREDVNVGHLLAQVLGAIRNKNYGAAVSPLLELRRFSIEQPLQMTDGEKLSLQNMEDSVTAALLVESELQYKTQVSIKQQ